MGTAIFFTLLLLLYLTQTKSQGIKHLMPAMRNKIREKIAHSAQMACKTRSMKGIDYANRIYQSWGLFHLKIPNGNNHIAVYKIPTKIKRMEISTMSKNNFEEIGITYHEENEVLIPDITLSPEEDHYMLSSCYGE